jgi:hypothetical protein
MMVLVGTTSCLSLPEWMWWVTNPIQLSFLPDNVLTPIHSLQKQIGMALGGVD